MATVAMSQSTGQLLLSGWRFHRGASEGAEAAAYDDSGWQKVSIPHDWAISGPFDKQIDIQVVRIVEDGEQEATEKTGRSGALPWIGEGWYRNTFSIPEGYDSAELIFDGAMSEPHVWVDGKEVGFWAFGYNVFNLQIPATPGQHSLAVHLQNREESSRWYPGAGIYRPVHLVLHKGLYLKTFETFARTTALDGINDDATVAANARLTVSSAISTPGAGSLSVRQTLLDADRHKVADGETPIWDGFDESVTVMDIAEARLWSPEHPVLYTLITEVLEDGKVVDTKETKVGIRSLEYTRDGFLLNGHPRKFKGVCLHHDMGPVGIAFYKDAFRRQVRLLKEIGCDAIRTSHNTPVHGSSTSATRWA